MTRHLTHALAGFLLVFVTLTAAVGIGVASVDPVDAHAAVGAPDPIATATAATDAGWTLVEQYGPTWGGMLLAFGLAAAALKRNESRHWIAQGRTLAIIVALVGTGETALQAHFTGAPWSGVVVTVVLALFKVLMPTVAPGPAPSSLARSAASQVSLLVLAVLAIGAVATMPACATLRPASAAGVGAFMDCEGKHIDAGLLAEAKALSKSAVQKWITGDGHIDATGLRAEAAPLRSDLMRCAFDAAIAALTVVIAPRTDTPALAAPLEVDVAELRTTWAEVRVELGWAPPAPSSSSS